MFISLISVTIREKGRHMPMDNLSSPAMEVSMVTKITDVPKEYQRPMLGAIHALKEGKVLQVDYDGYERLVEVHAVGVTMAGAPCMRVYQIDGGSISGSPTPGWRLMTFDKVENPMLTPQLSEAPRPGYRENDRGMLYIFEQIVLPKNGTE